MKVLLIALLALTSAAAEAASLEETYLTSRNQYIEKLARLEKSGGAGDKLTKQEELALNDLEKQLRNIIGEITIDGFSNQGKINLASLTSGDQGFGQLDGLSVSFQDGKAQVVITTDALLRAWLRGHKNWWGKDSTSPPNVPSRVEDALNSESFYTQALSTDAAVVKYAQCTDFETCRGDVRYRNVERAHSGHWPERSRRNDRCSYKGKKSVCGDRAAEG